MAEENEKMAAKCFKALAHPIRLRIIAVLGDKEMSVQQMAEALNLSQSNMSQHLTLLKERHALDSRREGKQVFYRVLDKKILKLIDLMQDIFCPPKK
ncbi:MAG: ArsR family transcriptional regulator [Candidatus Manganitrophaceae bacterium]|nr:MAG: ArsR family transcriptional regulator [Candidatus Manganitrophaceae bacterium]